MRSFVQNIYRERAAWMKLRVRGEELTTGVFSPGAILIPKDINGYKSHACMTH